MPRASLQGRANAVSAPFLRLLRLQSWPEVGGKTGYHRMNGVLPASAQFRLGQPSPGDSCIPEVDEVFKNKMQDGSVPLLATSKSYLASLPGRRCRWKGSSPLEREDGSSTPNGPNSTFLRLYKQPFYAADDDLKQMVDQLTREGKERYSVKYLAAPSASGKTSCILPAFLKGEEMDTFTHYLYFAFNNNDGRDFSVTPFCPAEDVDVKLAEKQGAAFALSIMKVLLETPDDLRMYVCPRATSDELDEREIEDLQKELAEYVGKKLGDGCKVLVQCDEHAKMCARGKDDAVGAAFSRGMMEALALIGASSSVASCNVVATYIERLTSISPKGSSGVCRYAVAGVCPDVDKIMANVPQLSFPHNLIGPRNPKLFANDSRRRRLWATLRFRLGFKLTEIGLQKLHLENSDKDMETFLAEFAKAAQYDPSCGVAEDRALYACIVLCATKRRSSRREVHATKLLLGADDVDDEWIRQVSDLVVVGDNRISASLESLLVMRLPREDPNRKLFQQGQGLFAEVLRSGDRAVKNLISKEGSKAQADADWLAGTPLEASYVWALSTRASVEGELAFGDETFIFECDSIYPGAGALGELKDIYRTERVSRLFPDTDNSVYNLSWVKDRVFYHAEERVHGLPPHPLADAWFRCSNQGRPSLVLLDFAGGTEVGVAEKHDKACRWIAAEQPNNENESLYIVILAPFADETLTKPMITEGENTRVQVVYSEEARRLLGGLDQVSRWLKD